MPVQRMSDCSRPGYLGVPCILSMNAITRNLLTIGLLFITLIFQRTVSMPSRLTIRSAEEDDGFVFPGTEDPWWNSEDQERTIKRETSRQGNDVEPTGDIVFPTEESEPRLGVFTPGPAPECRTKTYCENTNFYPAQYVDNLIKKHEDIKYLAGIDDVNNLNIVQRIGDDASTSLCVSQEKLIFPTSAQNRDNDWLFVVNQENFKQGVRIETCSSSDSECSVIGGIGGYRTMCKQKYIFRQMAAITANGIVIRDLFKLPSSCCCHAKFEQSYSRIGINSKFGLNNQTPVSNTRRRKRSSVNNLAVKYQTKVDIEKSEN